MAMKSDHKSDDLILTKFGERLKEISRQRKMSQIELSQRSGLHRNYISDAERGRRNVSLKSIQLLAMGLDVSIKDLF